MEFNRFLLTTACIGALIFCSLLNAQQPAALGSSAVVPRLVNFSGRAIDAQGKAVSGVAGVTFAIYRDQYEGAPLWMETQSVTADARGNYTVQLGATKPDGLPLDLFTTGEARWLGVRLNGGDEQQRVLLISVPYALKAADAQTLDGLPASAFMLAAPATATITSSARTASSTFIAPAVSGVTPAAVSGTGTTDFLPLWTNTTGGLGNSVLFQSGTGATAKLGINTTTPAVTLDVNGAENVHGILNLAASGAATATGGKNSQPLDFTASTFNSSSAAAVTQKFQWQAEAVGNDTASASGALSLLYASGTAAPAETGLKIASNGVITFAKGQIFPGGGVTSVGSGAGLTGGPITSTGTLSIANAGVTNTMLAHSSLTVNAGEGLAGGGTVSLGGSTTLNLNTSEVPLLASANLFTNNQAISGGTSTYGLTVAQPSYQTILTQGPQSGIGTALEMQTTGTGGMSWQILNTGTQASQGANKLNFRNDSGGVEVMTLTATGQVGIGTNNPTATLDVQGNIAATGNATQPQAAAGFVKAMVYVNAFTPPYKILNCYNSTLAGSAAVTPPCGINFTEDSNGSGYWDFDLGFEVDNRFFSVTTSRGWACAGATPISANTVQVTTTECNTSAQGAYFYLLIY
jgi:hypothetical protein